jgi:predicted PurR-regulated permease PerM
MKTGKPLHILVFSTLLILLIILLFWGSKQAYGFLMPLAVAALLAMIILPVAEQFEKWGVARAWASLFADLIVIAAFVGMGFLLAQQIQNLTDDWPTIEKRVKAELKKATDFVEKKTGISLDQQQQKMGIDKLSKSTGQERSSQAISDSRIAKTAKTAIGTLMTYFSNLLLIFIYIFFFLFYRSKLKKSILKFVNEEEKDNAEEIIDQSTSISQNYLYGKLVMILFLIVLYSIGLSVSGVNNAILIAIIAALLTFIPFVGNIIGFTLAAFMALISGAGTAGLIGVAITFTITQFVESYILQPYVVGDKVDLNPIITIIVVILGGAVWGLVGMLIAIPVTGIFKSVCDHIPALKPVGYLLGNEDIKDEKSDQDNFFSRTRKWAKQKFGDT